MPSATERVSQIKLLNLTLNAEVTLGHACRVADESLLVTEEQQVDMRTTCPWMEFEPMAWCDLQYFIKA